jgi:hypothetical protein
MADLKSSFEPLKISMFTWYSRDCVKFGRINEVKSKRHCFDCFAIQTFSELEIHALTCDLARLHICFLHYQHFLNVYVFKTQSRARRNYKEIMTVRQKDFIRDLPNLISDLT